jgi:biotin carboxyl carrier protein
MVTDGAGVAAAVKYEIVIDGKAATLAAADGHFAYQAEGEGCVECDYSAAPVADGAWSILIDGRSYAVQSLGEGEVSVNGRVFQVEVFDPRGPRGRRSVGERSGPQVVDASMPGRVVRVLVTVGQEVAAGEGLIVVEAMKMQNEMKAPRAGRVASVKAEAGATVSAGDILVVIE